MQYPIKWVLFEENNFITLLCLRGEIPEIHIWKCFRTVLSRKCGSFLSNVDKTNSTHSCLDYGRAYCIYQYARTPYLFECGVLHRLSLLGSFHNLLEDIRNNLTLSLFILIALEVGGEGDLLYARIIICRFHYWLYSSIFRNSGSFGWYLNGSGSHYEYFSPHF